MTDKEIEKVIDDITENTDILEKKIVKLFEENSENKLINDILSSYDDMVYLINKLYDSVTD